MRGFLYLVLSAVFCCHALARLGETEKECEERYGDPIHYAPSDPKTLVPDTQERWFFKHPFYVKVLFRHGRVVYLYFEDTVGFFDMDTESVLLEANKGSDWQSQNYNSLGRQALWFQPQSWISMEGDRIAYRVMGASGSFALVVSDKAFHDSAKETLTYFEEKVTRKKREEQEGALKRKMKGF